MANRVSRGSNELRRRGNVAPSRRLVVFTEGEKTEPQYLAAWSRRHKETIVDIKRNVSSDPLALVKAAIDAKEMFEREARRRRRTSDADAPEVWCAFDVDQNVTLSAALAQASDAGIEIALSNPCIELWFVWHREDQTGYINADEATKRFQELFQCSKHLASPVLDSLIEHHDEAVRRAKAQEKRHFGNGSKPSDNPSSSMWRLIESIRSAEGGRP